MKKVKQNPRLAWNQIDGQIVILETGDTPHFHELNETASFLWLQLTEAKRSEDLVESLIERFNVSKDQAFQDVEEFLGQLSHFNLLTFENNDDLPKETSA